MRDIGPPQRFICPLKGKVMKDPVVTPNGHNFERKALKKWTKENGEECPITGMRLDPSEVKPNALLQWEILYWKRKNNDSLDASSSMHSTNRSVSQQHRNSDLPPSMPLSLSEHSRSDAPPPLPRRKSSNNDLMSLCEPIQTGVKEKRLDVNVAPKNISAQSLILGELLRSLPVSSTSSDDDNNREKPSSEPMAVDDLLSVLDEVENTLNFVF